MLLLPGQPQFTKWLALPPPSTENCSYVVRPGSFGMMESVNDSQLDEYLNSGEYDERLDEIDNEELEINSNLWSSVLYLPISLCMQ